MSNQNIFDTIIIGGGPAGCAAAVYAARKKMKTMLITDNFGGQSINTSSIENWLGDISLSGYELAQKFEKHVRAQEGLEIKTGDRVEKINKKGIFFEIKTHNQQTFTSKTLIIATGGYHRQLNVPGEQEFTGKGVVYCSTCDAPLFKDKDVVVVGSGNAGLEAVIDLIAYAHKIYVFEITDNIKGDQILQQEIHHKKKNSDQVNFLMSTKLEEIKGNDFVETVFYQDLKTGDKQKIDVQGVFVEIGTIANSDIVKDVVKLDEFFQIKINHQSKQTSNSAIFAAGDVTDEFFKQNNIAAGAGTVAALSVYEYLIKNKL